MNELFALEELRHLGEGSTIRPMVKIVNPAVVSIGSHSMIDDFVFITGGTDTQIGGHCHIASFVSITGGGQFVMEDFAGIATGSRILTGTDDFSGAGLTGPTIPLGLRAVIRSFVHIGKHAVVGSNSVVHPGITIGEGAIIGSNSLVNRDVPSWTIVIGSPARFLANRRRDVIMQKERLLNEENG